MIYYCNVGGHERIPALYSCICNDIWHFLCLSCCKVHFNSLSNKEFLKPLPIEFIPHYEASRALNIKISLLESFGKECFKDLLYATKSITEIYNRFSTEIMNMKKELANTSYLLLNNPQALKEGELKRIYDSKPSDIFTLVDNLAVIKKEYSILNIQELINNWFSIELNFNLLDDNKPTITLSSALDAENKNLKCKNSHDLKWDINGLFRNFFKTRGKLFVKCYFCKEKLSKACWNCIECLYFVCKECGRIKGKKSRSLKCLKHHELLWKCDVISYYNYYFNLNQKNWKCDVCDALKVSAHWHCEVCTFDICKACIPEISYSSWSIPLISLSGNFFNQVELVYGKNVICSLCKEGIITNYYVDPEFNYLVCQKCAIYTPDESPGHPAISCSYSHILRWTNKLDFICNLCRVSGKGFVFYCHICKYYMCSKCSRFLENFFIEKREIFSSSCITNDYDREYHLLKWAMLKSKIKQKIICNYCSVGTEIDTGLFECYKCRLYVCIKCVSNSSQSINKIENQ
ncbi:hypothetical protein SteCoe_18874 [Stentor coeruleus]|uniref:Uncharacterized protein n=1 Tax=Stentor coeruleus TaxID=5963 RepID=A0A1R2BVJ8_9CILI|nr:hypothetical protein SteCoe_18874 [Stentor coeruleus]